MPKKLKQFLRHAFQSIFFWMTAMAMFGYFRFYGLDEQEGIQIVDGYQIASQMESVILLFALTGVLFGVIAAFIEFFFEKSTWKKSPLGLVILLKTLMYFIFLIIISTLMVELASSTFQVEINNDRGWWRKDKLFHVIILYIFFSSLVFSFIKIAIDKFGKGVFIKMLLGKYRNPQEEKRIFMFLDLKSSTTIAETLGHYKYSQLIQDCFYDINDIVPKFDAEIYQYVGDEVVLNWPYQKGLSNKNCVALFFEFQQKLNVRNEYYQKKYGLIPQFKAGLHGGVLMVAEVGVVKKELAFHGDVINTSARIQSECNTHGVPILISRSLKDDLNLEKEYITKALGNIILKGKKKEIGIYTLQKM